MYPYYSIFVQEMLSNVGNVRDVLQLSGELWYTDWVINLSGRFASSSPGRGAKTCLSYWERWHCEAMTERVRLLKSEVQLYGYNQ